jgi:hypothetical protein
MPFELDLPDRLKQEGWKVKIRDKERLEPPHATVLRGPVHWRLDLRTGGLMSPPGGTWRDLPEELRGLLISQRLVLIQEWDRMYPSNPVGGNHD